MKSPTIGYSNHFTEQRRKTTLVASAEKMKNVFCKTSKMIENPTPLKDHKAIQKLQRSVCYFTDEESDVSYV
ncbi:unnamed protein product [Onchocerca ochengi]|nr:unnamed protein product [Onchocerca ochengi]